jgi:thiamine-phosphate pyrophosphorylase
VARAHASAALPKTPFLYAIVDASMLGARPLTEWVKLVAGPDRAAVLQWRFKGLTDAQALEGARELRAATREASVLLFINDRPDIARIVGADGVHVGQEDLDPADVRRILPGALVGVSTHNPRQFEAALESPADYIAVGPVFGTASKANPDPVVGVDFVSWASSRSDRPIVAIGGLTESNVAPVVRAGARGLAVISEVMKAADPLAASRSLARQIRLAAG